MLRPTPTKEHVRVPLIVGELLYELWAIHFLKQPRVDRIETVSPIYVACHFLTDAVAPMRGDIPYITLATLLTCFRDSGVKSKLSVCLTNHLRAQQGDPHSKVTPTWANTTGVHASCSMFRMPPYQLRAAASVCARVAFRNFVSYHNTTHQVGSKRRLCACDRSAWRSGPTWGRPLFGTRLLHESAPECVRLGGLHAAPGPWPGGAFDGASSGWRWRAACARCGAPATHAAVSGGLNRAYARASASYLPELVDSGPKLPEISPKSVETGPIRDLQHRLRGHIGAEKRECRLNPILERRSSGEFPADQTSGRPWTTRRTDVFVDSGPIMVEVGRLWEELGRSQARCVVRALAECGPGRSKSANIRPIPGRIGRCWSNWSEICGCGRRRPKLAPEFDRPLCVRVGQESARPSLRNTPIEQPVWACGRADRPPDRVRPHRGLGHPGGRRCPNAKASWVTRRRGRAAAPQAVREPSSQTTRAPSPQATARARSAAPRPGRMARERPRRRVLARNTSCGGAARGADARHSTNARNMYQRRRPWPRCTTPKHTMTDAALQRPWQK